MRNENIKCNNCMAWVPLNDKGAGECRRGPPTAIAMPTRVAMHQGPQDMQVVSAFPPRQNDSWCMAFMPNAELMAQMKSENETKQ
jgi:hypothetical protein